MKFVENCDQEGPALEKCWIQASHDGLQLLVDAGWVEVYPLDPAHVVDTGDLPSGDMDEDWNEEEVSEQVRQLYQEWNLESGMTYQWFEAIIKVEGIPKSVWNSDDGFFNIRLKHYDFLMHDANFHSGFDSDAKKSDRASVAREMAGLSVCLQCASPISDRWEYCSACGHKCT